MMARDECDAGWSFRSVSKINTENVSASHVPRGDHPDSRWNRRSGKGNGIVSSDKEGSQLLPEIEQTTCMTNA